MFRPGEIPRRISIEINKLSPEQLRSLFRENASALVTDDRRRRPLYFDGRFLTARDLNRDQEYILIRQEDLNRSFGVGVVHGLAVRGSAELLHIQAGHGITAAGELVALPQSLQISVRNIPETKELNAYLGLSEVPGQTARARTGLFILALRLVEYTTRPTASYPTSIEGERRLQDGEIVEAVAITLIPYDDRGGTETDTNRRRSNLARDIFVNQSIEGLPVNALPLAMIMLRRGSVEWVDNWLVRREAGAQVEDVLGLGFTPHAVREAQFLQYRDQLADLLASRASGENGRFTASSYFSVLPPAGPMPVTGINAVDFSHSFFPPEVDVEMSIIPEDELLLLIEESLSLPPIDLSASGEELESTSVMVLIPVSRPQLRTVANALNDLRLYLRPTAPGLLAKRKPIESLLSLRRFPLATALGQPADAPADLDESTRITWQQILSGQPLLYYARQRNLSYRSDVIGLGAPVLTDDEEGNLVTQIEDRMRDVQIFTIYSNLRGAATDQARAEMTALFGASNVLNNDLLLGGAVLELEAAMNDNDGVISRATVLAIAERYTQPGVGNGVEALVGVEPTLASNSNNARAIRRSLLVPEIDSLARVAVQPTIPTTPTIPTIPTRPTLPRPIPVDRGILTPIRPLQPINPSLRPIATTIRATPVTATSEPLAASPSGTAALRKLAAQLLEAAGSGEDAVRELVQELMGA